MLAEDNVINRALANGILQKRGHSVVNAVTGREAVEAAAREPFDLIFMDVQMPEMDGFEATSHIRESETTSGHRTPIIAMTAHAMTGDRERCLAAGMDDYISKPLEKTKLLALLNRHGRAVPVAPKAADTTAGSMVFSRGVMLDQLDGDEELLQRMIAIFLRDTPRLLDDLRESVARGSGGELSSAAHALLSSLGVFGAKDAHRLVQQLETKGRGNDFADLTPIVAALERETERVYSALTVMAQPALPIPHPLPHHESAALAASS